MEKTINSSEDISEIRESLRTTISKLTNIRTNNIEQLQHLCYSIAGTPFHNHSNHRGLQTMKDIVPTIKIIQTIVDQNSLKNLNCVRNVDEYLEAQTKTVKTQNALRKAKSRLLDEDEDEMDEDEYATLKKQVKDLKSSLLTEKRNA